MHTTDRSNLKSNDKTYEKPQIVDHGDLTDLTAGKSTGITLDATFPVGTLTKDLTFSTP